jgi:hypothetical protein
VRRQGPKQLSVKPNRNLKASTGGTLKENVMPTRSYTVNVKPWRQSRRLTALQMNMAIAKILATFHRRISWFACTVSNADYLDMKAAYNGFTSNDTDPQDGRGESVVLALSVDVWQPTHDTCRANDTLIESLDHIGQTHEWQNPAWSAIHLTRMGRRGLTRCVPFA